MTEREWEVSDDPQAMLACLRGTNVHTEEFRLETCNPALTVRKLCLFIEGVNCRQCDQLTADREQNAYDCAFYVTGASCGKPQAKAALLRDIFGNPWHSLGDWSPEINFARENGITRLPPKWLRPILAWNDGLIHSMAQAIYEERTFDQLPILADALEEAGCGNVDILSHCRQSEGELAGCLRCDWTGKLMNPALPRGWQYCPHCAGSVVGPHVRGCWVIDLLLGKE